ncbi:MAG TPA: asparagine synthase (glutamine-hydrolyzing) [Terriglobales bacterium]|nr:asparagine synthase (glutamine-hydrolyzing) [Terriglobales bacterium]
MCGIAGYWPARTDAEGAFAVVDRMRTAIAHRGPDDHGCWASATAGIALGHARLSILDLSPAGHQPMPSACGRFVIVFNGEIYNHLELRASLAAAGWAGQWRGHSDTETLLACVTVWGFEETLRRAVGMFAIALWDQQAGVLKLARDRMGEKPLYYGWVGGAFAFASELKALRACPGFTGTINREALAAYMQYCYVPAPASIYSDVSKLPPGSVLTLGSGGFGERAPHLMPYWSIIDAARSGSRSPFSDDAEALDALDACLRRSISTQMIADVPLGAFLSGGIDSSLIVSLMQAQSERPVKTFTIGFDDAGFDEAPYARAVARHLGTDHHELRVRPSDALSLISSLPRFYDEPFADSSQIPTYFVCKAARSHVTVALSGDAGDELFGGYNRYIWGPSIWSRVEGVPFPVRRMLGRALSALSSDAWSQLAAKLPGMKGMPQLSLKIAKVAAMLRVAGNIDDVYRALVSEWSPMEGLVLGVAAPSSRNGSMPAFGEVRDSAARMMLADMLGYLPDDILTKVDRAAMSVSLETRVPFLDHRVIEAASRLPAAMKIRNGKGKWALRQLLFRHVPRELIERPKAGFAVPVGAWLRGPLRDWAEALLAKDRLAREGFLNSELVRAAWSQHLVGRHDWSGRLWAVLMFQAWLEGESGGLR